MVSFLLLFVIHAFYLIPLIQGTAPLVKTLSKQCWHEHPLSTIFLQSSCDGQSEIVSHVGSPASTEGTIDATPDHAPWTHPPICTEVLQTLGSKLCVYTNASFSNGRGISIFTTPRIAEEFANLPAFQDPDALKENDINAISGAWYTQQLAGKGIGMLAKKQLKFKERVTAYTPALVAHLEDELSTMEREKFFRVAVYQLPDATRESYLQLAFVYGQPSIRVQDIVKANTFQLQVGGQNHLAVFPETSRLNHACSPK